MAATAYGRAHPRPRIDSPPGRRVQRGVGQLIVTRTGRAALALGQSHVNPGARAFDRSSLLSGPNKVSNDACALIGFIPPGQVSDTDDLQLRVRHGRDRRVPGVE